MKQSPFQYFFLGIFVLLFVVILFSKPRPSLHDLFAAVNSIDQNPLAIIVLVIGCIMLVESKIIGIGDGLPSSIIGGALLLLKSQLTATSHTDSQGKTTTDITTKPPTEDPKSQELK